MRSLPDATEQLEACEPQAWVAGTVVGAYRVLGKLGSGGMSHVYDAERLRTGQRVALKVPHRSGLRSTARTLREARVSGPSPMQPRSSCARPPRLDRAPTFGRSA